jgi:beta-galactosidase GanA
MTLPKLVSHPKGIVLAEAIWYWPRVVDIGPADFELVKQHGYTHIKIDFWWHSLEPEEGVLETDGLVRILDLAAKEDVPVILNLFGAPDPAAPQWAYEKFPDAWFTDDRGQRYGPCDGHLVMAGMGAYPGLCWDSPQVRQAAESFFIRLVDAVKDHPSLVAWNVWAEPLTEPARTWGPERKFCYCRHTQRAFREWLMRKYETIDGLNAAWGTTYNHWGQVTPPGPPKRHHLPWMEWKTFLVDRIAANMAWRSEIFRRQDPNHPISGYPMTFSGGDAVPFDMDDWKLQAPLDSYGVSFYQAFHFPGAEVDLPGWMNHFDGIRSACEPTKQGQYILGENQVSQVLERVQTPPWQMRLSRLTALACGASAIWDWCLRLPYPSAWWASFGLARPDGTPGPWAGEIKRVNNLMNKIAEHWDMPRVHSRVAILFDPQTFYFCEAHGRLDLIKDSTRGFYDLAWDCSAPVDYVHASFITPEALAKYETLFIPYQPTLTREMARVLKEYVAQGGNVVTEAGFGYQKELGWAVSQVPHEMQEVFGCRTQGLFAEENPEIPVENGVLRGARYWEYYEPISGEVLGRHPDGSAAIVRNRYGEGTALVIGALVGGAYHRNRDPQLRQFLSAYVASEVAVENVAARALFAARLVHCREHDVLFLLNCGQSPETPVVRLEKAYATGTSIETGKAVDFRGNTISVEVPPRDVQVLLLEEVGK